MDIRNLILAVSFSLFLCIDTANAEVLVSDDFDSWTDWYWDQSGQVFPWSGNNLGVTSVTLDGETHSPGEVTSPGRGGSGKSYKTYRNGTTWTGNEYVGSVRIRANTIPGMGAGAYNSLYMRWYIKTPTNWSYPGSQKMFRFNFSNGDEAYFDFLDDGLELYLGSGSAWEIIFPYGDWQDGTWHALQFYMDIPTGTVTAWVDGNVVYDRTNLPGLVSSTKTFGKSDGTQFIQHFPYGNAYAGSTHNPGWAFFEIDDVVIATTKAETDPIEVSGELAAVQPPNSVDPVDPVTGLSKGTLLFSESFEDNTWSARGWYDGTNSTGTESGGYSGNGLKWEWASAATNPTGFSTIRSYLSQATDEFLVEYYVKYDSGWQGSGAAYHPHLIHIISSEDTEYQGFSASNSSLYIESTVNTSSPYTNFPVIAHQDLLRAVSDTNDLTGTTETRSANNCDTPYALTGASIGTCYASGDNWYSANNWISQSVSIPNNEWAKITAYVKMNSFTSGVGNFDGIMRLWVNDNLAIDSETVLYAAGAYEGSTWDKIALAPWIGDGSPITQTMWLDELSIWTVNQSGLPIPASFQLVQ